MRYDYKCPNCKKGYMYLNKDGVYECALCKITKHRKEVEEKMSKDCRKGLKASKPCRNKKKADGKGASLRTEDPTTCLNCPFDDCTEGKCRLKGRKVKKDINLNFHLGG